MINMLKNGGIKGLVKNLVAYNFKNLDMFTAFTPTLFDVVVGFANAKPQKSSAFSACARTIFPGVSNRIVIKYLFTQRVGTRN